MQADVNEPQKPAKIIEQQIKDGAEAGTIMQALAMVVFDATGRQRAALAEARQFETAASCQQRRRTRELLLAVEEERDMTLLITKNVKGIAGCLRLKVRGRVEMISKMNQGSEDDYLGDLSRETLDRFTEFTWQRLCQNTPENQSIDKFPPRAKAHGVFPANAPAPPESEHASSGDNNAIQDDPHLGALRAALAQVEHSPSLLSKAVAQLYLDGILSVQDLQAEFDQVRKLQAEGEQPWKDRWRRARFGLDVEKKAQAGLHQAIQSLVICLGLGAWSDFDPPQEMSSEELRKAAWRYLMEVSVTRHRLYQRSDRWLTGMADEIGVDLGIPRENTERGK